MNATLRRMIVAVPGMQRLYSYLGREYFRFRVMRRARRCFSNVDDFREALLHPVSGLTREIHTKDGVSITIRQSEIDAVILAQVWLDREYVRGLDLPDNPVVVDVGGFIGDFAIFAVKYLNASHVVVVEPSPSNWALLVKNVSANHYTDRITALHLAVTEGRPVMMDVDAPDQSRVSAYRSPQAKLVEVPGISLASLVIDQGLSAIDLLKIDCEGGEYLILETASKELLNRVHNIVFEFHETEGFSGKLAAVKRRLRNEGFTVRTRDHVVFASRRPDVAAAAG
jgi:FkbM family methyltransferase